MSTTTTTSARTAAITRNPALALFRMSAEGDVLSDTYAFAFALADLVTLLEIRPYRAALNSAMREARYSASPLLDWQPTDTVCPACGEQPDYCQGHGEIGDPDGAAVLEAHDDDDHDGCSRSSACTTDGGTWPDTELQADHQDGRLGDDDVDYACRVMLRYGAWLNSPAAGLAD